MKGMSLQRCLRSGGLVFSLLLITSGELVAEPFSPEAFAGTIVRVEEVWELKVIESEPNKALPQVACVIAPKQKLESVYGIFELNHATCPEFMAGGMQLQVWKFDWVAACKNFPKFDVMGTPNETVQFTVAMSVVESGLHFEVLNGTSITWGTFGGQGYLKASVTSSITSLNDYHPDFSVQNSGIVRGAHNVKHLKIKQVNYYSSIGLVATDNTPRIIHQYVEQVGLESYDE